MSDYRGKINCGPPVERVLAVLTGVISHTNGKGWEATCPAHEDRRRSLSVGVGDDGRVLLCCHAGCTSVAITAAVGLTLADLFPAAANGTTKSRGKIVAAYDYRSEEGDLLFQAVRFDPKGFSQRRPDGNGSWAWNLEGVRVVLYRLPELVAAKPGGLVFVVEGEKDVDNLCRRKLTATTAPMGAGKWRKVDSRCLRYFAGHTAVILPDNDAAGRSHTKDIAESLTGIAAGVRVLELPGLPPKGDVSDWLAAGGTREQLLALAEKAPSAEQWLRSQRQEIVTSSRPTPQPDREGSPGPNHHTDLGNARRFITRHGQDLRHCHPWRKWLCWDGCRWRTDNTAATTTKLKETLSWMFREAEAQIANVRKRMEDS